MWADWKQRYRAWREDQMEGLSLEGRQWLRPVFAVLAVYLFVALGLGVYWSQEPALFEPRERLVDGPAGHPVIGQATTETLIHIANTLLDKPGGFLHNDRFPPGVWLDNLPNWEYGVLLQVRDMSRALREAMSRSQSQSTEDADLSLAEPRFNMGADNWLLPSAESEYRDGVRYLEGYLTRLQDPKVSSAQFYARADNLVYWLAIVETRMGSLSQRLSASVGQRRLNTDLAGDSDATQSTGAPSELLVKTSWNQIDDVLYEARGSAWALLHLLKAVEIDFADVLRKKNALVSLRQIIRELEATQQTIYSPVVLNGSGFGLLANHSLVMANYLSRANAALIDLRSLLQRG